MKRNVRRAAIGGASRRSGLRLVTSVCLLVFGLGTAVAEMPSLRDEDDLTKADPEKTQPVLDAYRQALAANPVPHGIHLLYGTRLWQLGEVAESKRAFHREIMADPGNLRARAMLAIIKVQERHYSEAAEELQLLIGKNPKLTQIWHPLGRARFEMGMFEEAKVCLENAAAAKPGTPQIEALLAKTYAHLADVPKAKWASDLYEESRKLQVSRDLAAAGKWDQAMQQVSQYLAAFPTSSDGLYVKAGIQFNGYRNLDSALACARAAIAGNSANLEARNLLAVLLLAKGDSTSFVRELQDLIELDPLDARAHYYLGRFESDGGHLEDARTHLERAHLLQPTDKAIGVALAVAYEKLGMKEQAEAEYRRDVDAPRNQPSDGSTYTHYGAFLLNEGRIPEALRYLDQATALPAARAEAWYLAGMAHLQSGDTAQARRLLSKALERHPGYAEARSALDAIAEKEIRK